MSMNGTANQNGHRVHAESVALDSLALQPLTQTGQEAQDEVDFLLLLRLVEHKVKETGRLDYPPFVESIQDDPELQQRRERLNAAVNQISEGVTALERLLDDLGDGAASSEALDLAGAELIKGTHFLEDFHYQLRFYTLPWYFPWPNQKANSETQITSRLAERLKAIRYCREVVYKLFACQRQPHQTTRLRRSLNRLMTNSHDAAMMLSERELVE